MGEGGTGLRAEQVGESEGEASKANIFGDFGANSPGEKTEDALFRVHERAANPEYRPETNRPSNQGNREIILGTA